MLPKLILNYAASLRFPQLFLFALSLFIADLIIPDAIPFIDEILLGLAALLIASMRKPPPPPAGGHVFDNENSPP
jgi:hypothetical protein